MNSEALARSRDARNAYLGAVNGYLDSLRSGRERFEGQGRAWERAYVRQGCPNGTLEPDEAEELLQAWGKYLEVQMCEACGGVPSAELFFALRLLPPGFMPPLPWDAVKGDTVGTMAVRRTATYAAGLYGG